MLAVPDPVGAQFPPEAAEFWNVPEGQLGFPSLIIARSNDPFASLNYTRRRAAERRAGLVELGALGHINGESGLGKWQESLNLLNAFKAGQMPA